MNRMMLAGVLFVASLTFAGCAKIDAANHKYAMRGQILDVNQNTAYLCIGSRDGARAGQEFSVYKFERILSNPKMQIPNFKREETGTVKITEIVDEHYAKASILNGDVKVNYVVELK